MRKILFLKVPAVLIGFLFLFPLQAMERAPDDGMKVTRKNKNTADDRKQRDDYLKTGYLDKAIYYAIRVINENPEDTWDNEEATLDDYRAARDILAKHKDYLDDALSYVRHIADSGEETSMDYIIARTLYLKDGNYKDAAYYNDLLPENLYENSKK